MSKIKNFYDHLNIFLKSPLGEQVKLYSYYYIVVWLVHLIIISVVSYFHLLLNHSIGTIGDWIVDRGWTLIILSKLIVFILMFQFVKLKTSYLETIKKFFKNAIQWPRQEMYVCILFLILGLLSLGKTEWNSSLILELDRIILSIAGTVLFFAFDLVLIMVLDIIHPQSEDSNQLKPLFIFSFLFYFFTYITFQYEQIISLKLFAYFFLLRYAGIWRRPNWTLPLLFLMAFIVPAFSLLGLDPVWGHSYSFFKMLKTISTSSVFILIAFAVGYLQYNLKHKTEYILRE